MNIDNLLIKDLNNAIKEGQYNIAKIILLQNFNEVNETNLDIIVVSLDNLKNKGLDFGQLTLSTLITMTVNEIRLANTLFDISDFSFAIKYNKRVDEALDELSNIFNKCLDELDRYDEKDKYIHYNQLEIISDGLSLDIKVNKMDLFNFINCKRYGFIYTEFLLLAKILFKSKTFKNNFNYLASLVYTIIANSTI